MADPAGAAPPAPPATDFFAAQDLARRRARRYFVLFALCVVAVVAAMDVYVVLIASTLEQHDALVHRQQHLLLHEAIARLPIATLVVPIVVSLVLIVSGSVSRYRELERGSDKLAASLGARALEASPKDAAERQLRNVAEEMALASGGMPVAVYVLDAEPSINGFTGISAGEPFVVVTRGAMERLQRDELQGLLGYGIGQVRNGDAKLNLRLIGWLAGITVITDLGTSMLKAPAHVLRGADGEVGDFRKGMLGLSIPVAVLGMFVIAIGYVGTLLARIVRASVSRQRVFLADATAVQYTRDPVAVRDLLLRVEKEGGGKLAGAYKEEFGPMLFVPGVQRLCLRTHPKLHKRILRLEQRPAR